MAETLTVSAPHLPPLLLALSTPARFRQVAAAVPDLPAVVDGDWRITYAALDAWTDQVASAISAYPDARVEPVAVLCAHGPAALAAMLGVLKAGCIYCVVDPAMPAARLAHILTDLPADLVLADRDHLALAHSQYRQACRVLEIEALAAGLSPLDPPSSPAIDDPAAIYYSSGTTGQPKGILRDHAALVHRAWVDADVVPLGPGDAVAWLYSAAYSASVSDIFGALLNGAALHVYRLNERGIGDLAHWLDSQQIASLHLHANVLRQLLDAIPDDHIFRHLRYVRPSDRVAIHDLRRLRRHLPAGAVIAHSLGSSETGPVARFVCRHNTPLEGETAPVGFPLSKVEINLLDEAGEPVVDGIVGEIVVRSRYLARGYWRQPELTAQRFQIDESDPRYRIYRMGDLAQRRSDGMLELVGRSDRRVKIRGYSVDLGVVEAALSAQPGVAEAVAVAQGQSDGARRLAAYVVPAPDSAASTSEIRAALAGQVPHYMMPARIGFVAALPRQPNGKVDISALPAIGQARPNLDTPFVAPRSELEQQIADIWAELLELDVVGVADNFFELGGDSILAMRMALAVEQVTGGHVLPAFFRTATVAQLAEVLAQGAEAPQAIDIGAEAQLPAGSLQKHTQSVRGRLRTQGIGIGPLWRGYGLPYGLGVRLQRLLVAQPFMYRRYADQLAVVQRWSEELGIEGDSAERVTISLLANTWLAWRKHALSQSAVLSKWLKMSDPHNALLESLPSSAGIVLAVPHAGKMGSILLEVCRHSGRETGKIVGGVQIGPKLRSEMLLHAQRILRRGGVVMVPADGLQGWRAVDVPFWGRRRPFQIGAAELAVTTGAALVPAYIHIDAQGYINAEIAAPLIPQTTAPQAQIIELVERYGADYAARWPQFYASIRWHLLSYSLNLQSYE